MCSVADLHTGSGPRRDVFISCLLFFFQLYYFERNFYGSTKIVCLGLITSVTNNNYNLTVWTIITDTMMWYDTSTLKRVIYLKPKLSRDSGNYYNYYLIIGFTLQTSTFKINKLFQHVIVWIVFFFQVSILFKKIIFYKRTLDL